MFLRRRGGPPRPRALRALAAALVGAGLVALACRPYRPADLSTIAEPRLLVDPGQELAWPELPIFGEGAGAPDDAASEAAVVIDLSEYRELPPRAGGERNADAWVQYFADVRGIPPQRLFALRGAQANPDRILAAVQSAGDLTGKDGRLWIIFIGHGATDLETSEGFLLTFGSPSDAPLDRRHALPVRALTGDLIDWVPSPPIVVLDACAPPELGLGAAAIGGVEPILEGPGTEPVLVFIVGGHILVAGGPEYGTTHRGLRGAVVSAGLGSRCLGELPGGDRPALSYWLLGALQGWGEARELGDLGAPARDRWARDRFRRDRDVFAGEALDFIAAIAADVVDGLRQTPAAPRGLSRRSLRLARDARHRTPTIAELTGTDAPKSPLLFAGGARIQRPPASATWKGVSAGILAQVEPLLREAQAPSFDPEVLAERWCHIRATDSAVDALVKRECQRWRRYARRWRAFHTILDYDHQLLRRFLAREPAAAGAAAMRGFLDTYAEFAGHPRVVAVAEGLRAHAAGDPRWQELALFGPTAAIPGDRYFRGCTDPDEECEDDEIPQHRRVSAFLIDRREVARREYDHCVQAGACEAADYASCYSWTGDGFVQGATLPPAFEAADVPQVCITRDQAQGYCEWLGKRLPTELEWEVAARGGDRRIYPWGDEPPSCADANHSECGRVPWPVDASGRAGANGLAHVAGNVSEWVFDWYESYRFTALVNPRGPSVTRRVNVVRGGSFYDPPEQLRVSYRYALTPSYGYATVGVRCVAG